MAPVKLALVNFPAEKTQYVVPVEDIVDFQPKHYEDFDRNKLYEVRWPVLRRETSSPTAKSLLFKGHVKLLAASPESMFVRAKKLRIRLPQSFAKQLASTDCTTMTAKSSKRTKKIVENAMANECKKRMSSIYSNHIRSLFGNKNSPTKAETKSSTLDRCDSPATADDIPIKTNVQSPCLSKAKSPIKIRDQSPTQLINTVKDDHSGQMKMSKKRKLTGDDENEQDDEAVSHVSSLSQIIELPEKVIKTQGLLSPERKKTKCDSSFSVKDNAIITDQSSIRSKAKSPINTGDQSPSQLQNTDHSNQIKMRNKRKCKVRTIDDEDEEEEDEAVSYVSSLSQIKELQDKVIRTQGLLNAERKKVRILDAELTRARDKLQRFRNTFDQLVSEVQELFSDTNAEFSPAKKHSQPMSSSPALVRKDPTRLQVPSSVKKSPRVASWVESTLLEAQKSADKKKLPNSPGSSVKRQLFDVQFDTSTPIKKGFSPTKNPSFDKTKQDTSDSIKNQQQKKKKKSTKEKCDEHPSLGPDERDRRALSYMLLKVLEGKENLQCNGTHVNIGNDTWVKKKNWDAKFSKQGQLSLLVKDMAEEVWGYQRCAEMSVTGGKSPKTPNAPSKPTPPPGEMEAILGFYRALLMKQGMPDNNFLDDMVEETGKLKYLRGKFQDAAKKVKKEKSGKS